MNNRFSPRYVLPLLAGIALLGVALFPKTAWVARPELTSAMGVWPASEIENLNNVGLRSNDIPVPSLRRPEVDSDAAQERIDAFLAAHPQEIGMQIVEAVKVDNKTCTQRLKALTKKHPQSPAVYATLLRFTVLEDAPLKERSEVDILISNPPYRTPFYVNSMYGTLRPFDEMQAQIEDTVVKAENVVQNAEIGEKLDPENAFFPWMKSIALFSLNRDEEAITTLHQATMCPRFNDYTQEEARDVLSLAETALGKQKAILNFSRLMALTRYPHYGALQNHARLIVALAINREKQGDAAGGMALRHDLATVSQTMQRAKFYQNGFHTASFCEQTAYLYPGAKDLPKPITYYGGMMGGTPSSAMNPANEKSEQVIALKEKAWHDYAVAHGASTMAERPTALNNLHDLQEKEENESTARLQLALANATMYDLLASNTLTMSMILLLLGGVFWVFLRFTRIRNGQPAHRAVSWGIGINVACPLISIPAALIAENYWGGGAVAGIAGILLVGILLGVAGTRLVSAEGSWARRITLFISTLLAPAGVITLLACLFTPSISIPLSYLGLNYGGMGESVIRSSPAQVGVLGIWAIPLLLLLYLTIASRIKRVPATVGITRGFVRWTLPLASLLILLYALTTPYRTRMHDTLREHVKQIAQDGGNISSSHSEIVNDGYIPGGGAPTD
jgi:hypothetical protein